MQTNNLLVAQLFIFLMNRWSYPNIAYENKIDGKVKNHNFSLYLYSKSKIWWTNAQFPNFLTKLNYPV